MIDCNLVSTSSAVHDSLREFCDISSHEVATPPAFAAFPGAKRTLFVMRYLVASSVVGIFAPSATAMIPFATRCFASSRLSSFCVAQGNAISAVNHRGFTHAWYSIPSPANSLKRPRV